MSEYIEVEEPSELRRLVKALATKLKARLTYSEDRDIGDPSGTYRRRVHFEPDNALDALYWSGGLSDDRRAATALNLFGHGTPGATTPLLIEVQFSVPVATFSRRTGGAFLLHRPTGRTVLAHRGIATLGHGRIKRADLFREMDATLREAETSDGVRDFLLICELESPTLIEDISRFASEFRRVVRLLKATNRSESDRRPNAPSKSPAGSLGELRAYFDEFSGERFIKRKRNAVADCYHGNVVRALRDAFGSQPKILKSREIDLTVITERCAFLFEVKTGTTPQYIYTAIGQLTVHAPAVAKHAGGVPVVKVIVLPAQPGECFRRILTQGLGIRIVTFTRSAQGQITVHDLDTLP
jgi:hypothetical protein